MTTDATVAAPKVGDYVDALITRHRPSENDQGFVAYETTVKSWVVEVYEVPDFPDDGPAHVIAWDSEDEFGWEFEDGVGAEDLTVLDFVPIAQESLPYFRDALRNSGAVSVSTEERVSEIADLCSAARNPG